MQRDTLKKYYIVHSWVGVITGILMFVIAFSGAVSVFGSPELKLWTNPVLHRDIVIDPATIDELTKRYGAEIGDEYKHEVLVLMPGASAYGDFRLLFMTEHGENERMELLNFDPQTLELKQRIEGTREEVDAQQTLDMESFITHFHADLHLGRLGQILTGLLGLTLMASIVSGLIIHRKILKEMLVFRPFRSLRLMLTDTHKVLSVWGILFHGMIGFTGAFLGLATVILLPAAAFVSFEGDQEKLFETFQPERMPELSGEAADMQIDKVLAHSLASGAVTRSITIMGWGDKNALAFVDTVSREGREGDDIAAQTNVYRLDSGEFQQGGTTFSRVGGVSGPVLDVMFPLHFGSFGGPIVRIVWGLLGLSTALIVVTGVMIWVERRAYGAEGKLAPHTYMRLSKLTIGSCSGMVLATVALFWLQRLAPDHVVSGFFTVWLASIATAFAIKNNYQSNRLFLALSGALLMGLPVLDALVLEQHLFNSGSGTHTHLAIIEATLMGCGALLLHVARLLPSQRPTQKQKTSGSRAASQGESVDSADPSVDCLSKVS